MGIVTSQLKNQRGNFLPHWDLKHGLLEPGASALPMSYLVVASGRFLAFHVVFVALEYIPTIPPHTAYVIVSCLILLKS